MAKKEVKTDFWVYGLLKEAEIELEPQGSSIKEINEALKTASKNQKGNVGFPEFVGVVKDFLLVIENKADVAKHIKLDEKDLVSFEPKDIQNYAVNGALFYGKHLAKNTNYKKIFAFGISGDEKRHIISPYFIDEIAQVKKLNEIESFISFSKDNISEYYLREVLNEPTNSDKELKEILKEAALLHEDLRNYGNLKDIDKPLIVSGILLALKESEHNNFSIDELNGDEINTDGEKIFKAIEYSLKRAKVAPEVKRDKILSQFSIIKDMQILNEINPILNKTPLRHYTEFLYKNIYKNIRYNRTSEDYLGRFYGEFMSYSGGDGQTLGIVLTPKHITDLFCDLVDIKKDDIVLDPCSGTGGFLIASMHHMLQQTKNDREKKLIKRNQLHGFEIQPYMFTIATTNMILRGDGKSNLLNEDFLKQNPSQLQVDIEATVGMMNPPYSQGSKNNPHLYEMAFVEHLLDSLSTGARCAVIVPQSSMTGKTKEEKAIKTNILKKHTLEGVITLNKDTFYKIGVMPCIALFTAGEPHEQEKEVKFIDFRDDGYKVNKHIGLIETEAAKDKKQHLLDVWFDRIEETTKFCVKTTIEAEDEWLHSFYYFNDEIPSEEEFEKTVGDYLTFEFSMIMQGREYLFEDNNILEEIKYKEIDSLENKKWKSFIIYNIFNLQRGKRQVEEYRKKGKLPYYSASKDMNGLTDFISNPKFIIKTNAIIYSTFGDAYYVEKNFSTSDEITILTNGNLKKYNGLFISQALKQNKQKYSFGRKAFSNKITKDKILLPINAKNEPDYEYMEQYIKNLIYKKINKYLKYIERQKG